MGRLEDRVAELERQVRALREASLTTEQELAKAEAKIRMIEAHPAPLEYGCIWNDCRHSRARE